MARNGNGNAVVAGAPVTPRAGAGAPVVWAKPGKGGMAAIRLHAAGATGGQALTACGKLQANSTYLQPAYKPLHALYATTPQGVAAVATGRVAYANGNTAANVVCVACCKLVPTFGALVARARKPQLAKATLATPCACGSGKAWGACGCSAQANTVPAASVA